MPGWVLLAATKKLAELAQGLNGTAMCHDLVVAAPEAVSQAASTAMQKTTHKSSVQACKGHTARPGTSWLVKWLHEGPATSYMEPSHAMKQRPG